MTTIMIILNVILVISLIGLIGSMFMFHRNGFVYERQQFAIELAGKHSQRQINDNAYVLGQNNYTTMLKTYEDLLYKEPFNFNKYSAIKPEYVDLLKQYEENENEK